MTLAIGFTGFYGRLGGLLSPSTLLLTSWYLAPLAHNLRSWNLMSLMLMSTPENHHRGDPELQPLP